MKSFFRRIIYLYIFIFILISVFYYINIITPKFLYSSILAGLINFLNAFSAVKLFQISYKKGGSSFLLYNFGGMGIRLAVLLILILIIIKFLNIDLYGFIFIFFLFYFITLILEVIFYAKYKENSKF